MFDTIAGFVTTHTAAPVTTVVAEPSFADQMKAAAAAKRAELASAKVHGIKVLNDGRLDTFKVNPYLLKIEPGLNPRDLNTPENQEHIDTLAKSVAEVGVKEHITVVFKNGELVVTHGECRTLAAIRAIEVYGAEIATVPVKTEDRGASVADQILNHVIRNTGKPLTPLEQGSAFKRLQDLGWDVKTMAAKAGLTEPTIVRLIEMQAVTPVVRDMIKEGKVSPTLAWQSLKANGDDAAASEAELVTAVANAQAQGKGKATAKHVDGPATAKVSLKKAVKALVEAAVIDDASSEDKVTVTLTAAQFTQLKDLLGM